MASSEVSWADCECLTETFKVVDHHEIKVEIILPPKLKSGKHPVIIAYHGGYLISGARNHYMFMAAWLPAYAASTSAIIVSPDYRLFPSATTAEILSDVEDLWAWVHNNLPSVVSSRAQNHEVDLAHVLVEGNSEGGFCVAHLAMNYPDSIRAAIMVYPMLDCLTSDFTQVPAPGTPANIPFQGEDLDARIKAA